MTNIVNPIDEIQIDHLFAVLCAFGHRSKTPSASEKSFQQEIYLERTATNYWLFCFIWNY